jgi:hypothetical protein
MPLDIERHRPQILGAVLRIVAGLLVLAIGTFLGISGVGMLWAVLAPGSFLWNFYIEIDSVRLTGWRLYICAALILAVAGACIGLGLWLITKSKRRPDNFDRG